MCRAYSGVNTVVCNCTEMKLCADILYVIFIYITLIIKRCCKIDAENNKI